MVLLPQPDSPTKAKVSPSWMVKEMSSTALTTPAVRLFISPVLMTKCLTALRDSIITSPSDLAELSIILPTSTASFADCRG